MKYLLCVLGAMAVPADAVIAQAPPTPPAQTAPPGSASNCGPSASAPPRSTSAQEAATTGQRAEPLSDKLAKADGVLCPPAGIDPDIRAPTPNGGNMPVIPPPGSPGGDSTVRPK